MSRLASTRVHTPVTAPAAARNAGAALYRSEVIGAVPALLASAETLYNVVRRAPVLTDWSISRQTYAGAPRIVRAGLDLVARDRVNTAIHAVRVVSNAALLVAPPKWRFVRAAASLASGLSTALLSPRERYGSDGADQATAVVQISNGVGRLGQTRPHIVDAAVWNVSLQSCMSYAAAGWIKLAGGSWRDGSAVTDILRTRAYGNERMWRLLDRHPALGRVLTWSVLGFECAFPIVYALPPAAVRVLVTGALGFHVVNGHAMGLWRFVFAFASMHPQLMATTRDRRRGISAATPLMAVVATGGAMAVSVVASVLRRRRVRDQVTMRVDTGARLGVEVVPGDTEKPIVVFESGLLGLPEHYAWLRRSLHEAGYATVAYCRPGLGASAEAVDGDVSVRRAAANLAALVRSVRSGHPGVVLVGHSLGGEIVRRVAEAPDALAISGVVYLDPTHPDQLSRSEAQRSTVRDFSDNLASFDVSTRLSLGTFLTVPAWIRTLPADAQARAADQFRDGRLWRAGRREWTAMRQDLAQGVPVRPNPSVPALLVSAGRTLQGDPDIRSLHQEIIDAHTGSELVRNVVIEDVTHDSMLTNPDHAARLARTLAPFLEDVQRVGRGPRRADSERGVDARSGPAPSGDQREEAVA
jgi:pimeloyl-ACP methyl ester carboxylesterase